MRPGGGAGPALSARLPRLRGTAGGSRGLFLPRSPRAWPASPRESPRESGSPSCRPRVRVGGPSSQAAPLLQCDRGVPGPGARGAEGRPLGAPCSADPPARPRGQTRCDPRHPHRGLRASKASPRAAIRGAHAAPARPSRPRGVSLRAGREARGGVTGTAHGPGAGGRARCGQCGGLPGRPGRCVLGPWTAGRLARPLPRARSSPDPRAGARLGGGCFRQHGAQQRGTWHMACALGTPAPPTNSG